MNAAAIRLEKVGGGLAREVKASSGTSPMSCYQCTKCTSGCPVASRADVKPHELVRLIQMDQRRAVLGSRFIWECTSCQTCVTRCPQKVDIAAMNDALRAMSIAAGMAASGTAVPVFNQVFLNGVRKRGRVHEMGLMVAFKLRTLRIFADAGKAPMMFAKGKLSLFGARVRGKAERKAMFRRAAGGNPVGAGFKPAPTCRQDGTPRDVSRGNPVGAGFKPAPTCQQDGTPRDVSGGNP